MVRHIRQSGGEKRKWSGMNTYRADEETGNRCVGGSQMVGNGRNTGRAGVSGWL